MPVLRRTLRTLRWQIVGYGIGLFAWAAMVVLLYPSIRDAYAGIELPEAYSAFFGEAALDFGDFRNFVSVEFYQWVPLVMTIYIVVTATGTLAGDESRGVLEVLLTQPLSRTRVFFEKVGALLIGMLGIAVVAAAGLIATVPFVEIQGSISLLELVIYVFATLPFVLLIGSLSLLLAVIAPTRGTAAAIASAVVVASWLAASLADLSSQTEWLKYVSGYYYTDVQRMPSQPPVPWHQALVFAISAVQVALAAVGFHHREIEVGTWQFHLRGTRLRRPLQASIRGSEVSAEG